MPALAAPPHIRTVTLFCQDPWIPQEYVSTIEICVRIARYLTLLEDDQQSSALCSPIQICLDDLESVKVKSARNWTPQNQVVLQTAQIYLRMSSFVALTGGNAISRTSQALAKTLLNAAQDTAIQLISYVSTLSAEAQTNATNFLEQTQPFPGAPKHTARIVFFAATVLLKFLETQPSPQCEEGEAARNAFQRAHHSFHAYPRDSERMLAGKTLEVAGRAIGNGKAQLRNNITTRMGASVMFNTIWLGGILRGRDHEAEYSGNIQALSTLDQPRIANETETSSRPEESNQSPLAAQTNLLGVHSFEPEFSYFPFGVWDDDIFDEWASMSANVVEWNNFSN